MNIALVGPYFSSSGTTKHVTNIFNGLTSTHTGDVFLITFRESNESNFNEYLGPKIITYNKIPSPILFEEFAEFISEKIIENQINILLPQIKPFILFCASLVKSKLLEKGYKILIIGTWHSNFSWIVTAPYHLAMSKMGINSCDGIIPVSKDVENSLQYVLNFDPTKILPIIPPGGIDFENVNKNRSKLLLDIKNRFSINRKYIIFLGRLLYNKGLDTLISAFNKIDFDGYLVIIGSGPYEKELKDKISALNLEKRIIFTKFITDDEVYSLLQGAELYCLPSRWESFSISTLEAMGAGIPVVCSNVGGLGMWASEAAILIEPENEKQLINEVDKVLNDENLANELRKKSIKLSKKFDYKAISENTLESISSHIERLHNNEIIDERDLQFQFNDKTGEITANVIDLSKNIKENMKITDYALYFPSEALKNENKNVDPTIKYFVRVE
ncbi:MAG: Mannosylfructose-phosphate synthase [Candidatus Heimdallarchaeota archaeon LC_2]|nr:MAG: Mannosylfructose-phosphate synthase [Candidatus Heimdallarchaeota archaeon LC_2]